MQLLCKYCDIHIYRLPCCVVHYFNHSRISILNYHEIFHGRCEHEIPPVSKSPKIFFHSPCWCCSTLLPHQHAASVTSEGTLKGAVVLCHCECLRHIGSFYWRVIHTWNAEWALKIARTEPLAFSPHAGSWKVEKVTQITSGLLSHSSRKRIHLSLRLVKMQSIWGIRKKRRLREAPRSQMAFELLIAVYGILRWKDMSIQKVSFPYLNFC